MELKYEEFESVVATKLLSGDHPDLTVLRNQYARATLRNREWLDNQVTVYFDIPEDAPRTNIPDLGFADVCFILAGEDARGWAFLAVKDGRIEHIDCVNQNWSAHSEIIKVDYGGKDDRDMDYVRHIFAKHKDLQLGSHLIAIGSHGEYDWLTTGHEIGEFLELCPEVVLGKHLAVTALDSGVLRLNEREISLGWKSTDGIGYSPRVNSIPDLPHLNHPDLCSAYHEWYVFETDVCLGKRSDAHPLVMPPQAGIVEVFVNCFFRIHDPYFRAFTDPFWNQLERIRPVSYIADGDSCLTFVTRDRPFFAAARERLH
jgi:hypothetical protein